MKNLHHIYQDRTERTPVKISTESQIAALEIFSSDSYISINKNLLKMFGPDLSIFICNLIDKYKYFLGRNMIENDGSFFLTHENQSEQTGMSKYQLRSCKAKLKEMRVLKTILKGAPPKEFYFISIENLLEKYLTNISKETEPFTVKKLNPLRLKNLTNNKETKVKENLYKENKKDSSIFLEPDKVFSLWNKMMEETALPQIIKLSSSRRNKIISRYEDLPKLSDWKKLFRQILNSPFLLGENDRGWVADFDWVISNDKNYLKILEGKYNSAPKRKTRIGGAKLDSTKYQKNVTIINTDDE